MRPTAEPLLRQAAAVLGRREPIAAAPNEVLYTGVDLGTATIVLLVIDEGGRPIAGRLLPAEVVRDGLVVDFIGAVDRLQAMKTEVEAELGCPLSEAAAGYPPGVPAPEIRAVGHVLQSAGLECKTLIDEPSAANHVLGVSEGAIVDVGGVTTGIAIVKDGQVIHTADEPTGGVHFSLVIAGGLNLPFEEAEHQKLDMASQPRLMGLVRPVIEKVAAIIARQLDGHPVDRVYLVGGASIFAGMEAVVEDWLGLPVTRAPNPQLVTPLGIAEAHRITTRTRQPDYSMDSAHGR